MTPHELLCQIVSKEVGVKESGGDNHGPRVEEYQKSVEGFKADGQSWCMAFVQWGISNVECLRNISSPILKHEHCMTVWNKSPESMRVPVDKVFPGCIIIWQHDGTSNGHTGVVVAVTDNNFGTVEGNTSPGNGIDRNGDGVYARVRTKKGGGGMTVVGFLDPFKA